MRPVQGRILAPFADMACIVAFVLGGRQSHDLEGGAGWFITVAWPFAVAWLLVSLLTRLYSADHVAWGRLSATWIVATATALLLRVVATGRTVPLSFAIVAFVFLGVTTFGWRLALITVIRARRGSGTGLWHNRGWRG